jgi:hypothetical protein
MGTPQSPRIRIQRVPFPDKDVQNHSAAAGLQRVTEKSSSTLLASAGTTVVTSTAPSHSRNPNPAVALPTYLR